MAVNGRSMRPLAQLELSGERLGALCQEIQYAGLEDPVAN